MMRLNLDNLSPLLPIDMIPAVSNLSSAASAEGTSFERHLQRAWQATEAPADDRPPPEKATAPRPEAPAPAENRASAPEDDAPEDDPPDPPEPPEPPRESDVGSAESERQESGPSGKETTEPTEAQPVEGETEPSEDKVEEEEVEEAAETEALVAAGTAPGGDRRQAASTEEATGKAAADGEPAEAAKTSTAEDGKSKKADGEPNQPGAGKTPPKAADSTPQAVAEANAKGEEPSEAEKMPEQAAVDERVSEEPKEPPPTEPAEGKPKGERTPSDEKSANATERQEVSSKGTEEESSPNHPAQGTAGEEPSEHGSAEGSAKDARGDRGEGTSEPHAASRRHTDRHGSTGKDRPADSSSRPPASGGDNGPPPSQPGAEPPTRPIEAAGPTAPVAHADVAEPAARAVSGQRHGEGEVAAVQRGEGSSESRSAPTANASRTPGMEQADRVRFVQRVARAFEAMDQRNGTIRLRLHPPELGSLKLHLTVRNGTMDARLEVETAAARSALLENLPALRERLAEHQIKVERFDIDLRDQSSGGSSQGPDQQSQSREHFRDGRGGQQPSPRGEKPGEAAETRPRARRGDPGRLDVFI